MLKSEPLIVVIWNPIYQHLGVKPQSVAPIRNNLIKKGMIYSPAHGDTDFTVPLFGDFMKRNMSGLE